MLLVMLKAMLIIVIWTHHKTEKPDIQLLDMIKQAKPKHLAKYVLILTDKIYLKEGLVYKCDGSLIGFADLGGTLQQLSERICLLK